MSSSLANISGILLDIEGTTTPIAFVHEVLFSYARSQVGKYLAAHFDSAETLADIARLREEHGADIKQGLEPPAWLDGPPEVEIDSITEYVRWLIERDRKYTGLKSLQGKIWKDGYLDGTLKAQVFADVPRALKRWHDAGLKISIFSSGSALAQRLLFAHTEAGDLTSYVDNYFDTTNGSKTNVESYRRIVSGLGLRAEEILFVSDVVGELDAARAAGMQTLLCIRPGNQIQSLSQQHQIIQSFDELGRSP